MHEVFLGRGSGFECQNFGEARLNHGRVFLREHPGRPEFTHAHVHMEGKEVASEVRIIYAQRVHNAEDQAVQGVRVKDSCKRVVC